MNVTVEDLPRRQSRVTIEVEPERMATAREDAYARIAREAVIPGFRKGRAPRYLVERYINADRVRDEAEHSVMDAAWDELRESQFKDVALYDTPQADIKEHDPFVFEMMLTMGPQAALGEYKGIRIAPELVTITDEDVTKAIEAQRTQQAQWQPVEHRPVREGDMLTVQTHGRIGPQPVVVPQGYSVVVNTEARFILPGFAMRMIDMEIGKEKEFAVEVPEDVDNKEVAGQKGSVFVTVQEIKEQVLPALNDAFATSLDYASVDDMQAKTRESLQKAGEEAARDRLEDKILDAIAGVSTIEFPEVMVDRQVDSIAADREASLRRQGIEMPLFLQIMRTTMDEYRAQLRPTAERRLRNYLLIEELLHAEGALVEESAVNAEIERLAALQTDPAAARRELSTNQVHEQIERQLQLTSLFDRLIALVTEGQTPVAPPVEQVMPSITDTIATNEEPAENKQDKPKLIIASR